MTRKVIPDLFGELVAQRNGTGREHVASQEHQERLEPAVSQNSDTVTPADSEGCEPGGRGVPHAAEFGISDWFVGWSLASGDLLENANRGPRPVAVDALVENGSEVFSVHFRHSMVCPVLPGEFAMGWRRRRSQAETKGCRVSGQAPWRAAGPALECRIARARAAEPGKNPVQLQGSQAEGLLSVRVASVGQLSRGSPGMCSVPLFLICSRSRLPGRPPPFSPLFKNLAFSRSHPPSPGRRSNSPRRGLL